jgi:tetratricopeptide (TPR) repeat protein
VYGLHAWAMLEQRLGNWSKARSLLERAALVQPGNAVVHQTRALLEARVHNYAAARHHFRLAVDVAPTDIKCWQAWALFEASQQKVQKMRSLFKQALKVDPENMHSLQVCRFHPQFIVVSFKCKKSVGTSLYVFSTFHHSTILRQYLLGFSNQSHT